MPKPIFRSERLDAQRWRRRKFGDSNAIARFGHGGRMRYGHPFAQPQVPAEANQKAGQRDHQFQQKHQNGHGAFAIVAGGKDGVVPIDGRFHERRNSANHQDQGDGHMKGPAQDLAVSFAFPSGHGQIVLLFLVFRTSGFLTFYLTLASWKSVLARLWR